MGLKIKWEALVESGDLPLNFQIEKQILSLNPMRWFVMMLVVDVSRSAGGGYPIEKPANFAL
jgi:hypothetical protein